MIDLETAKEFAETLDDLFTPEGDAVVIDRMEDQDGVPGAYVTGANFDGWICLADLSKVSNAGEKYISGLKEQSIYSIAEDMAGCLAPDNRDSPGALFLEDIRKEVIDLLANIDSGDVDISKAEDRISLLVDSDVPVLTHSLWLTFVDLGGYQEEFDEFPSTVTDIANLALFQIGERFARAALEAYKESFD